MSAERDASAFQGTKHLRDLDERHSVVTGIKTADDARAHIEKTFADRPDLVIIQMGVAKEMSQREIARALEERGLSGASQATVGRNIEKLERLHFLKKPKKGPHVVRPGWDDEFNLQRDLKRILRKHKVAPP